jgi:hypothetical protein
MTTNITVADQIIIQNGPVQFGEDWPGTFLSISFIKKNIKPAEEIQPVNVVNADLFSKMYINSVYNSLLSSISNPLYENTPVVDDVSAMLQEIPTIKIEDEAGKSLNRVETGFVTVNEQHGYFIRGDNSAYMVYTLSMRDNLSAEEIAFRDLLSKCIVGGFQFKT